MAHLPEIRRIGLVKCGNITDQAIYALIDSRVVDRRLERVHLSYCINISIGAVLELINACPRLIHLSLTGVPAFQRPDLQQFGRPPPKDYSQHQRQMFCVFSGKGVRELRHHLNGLDNTMGNRYSSRMGVNAIGADGRSASIDNDNNENDNINDGDNDVSNVNINNSNITNDNNINININNNIDNNNNNNNNHGYGIGNFDIDIEGTGYDISEGDNDGDIGEVDGYGEQN